MVSYLPNSRAAEALSFVMDTRTGLGRFREFRIRNDPLVMNLIDAAATWGFCQVVAAETGRPARRPHVLGCGARSRRAGRAPGAARRGPGPPLSPRVIGRQGVGTEEGRSSVGISWDRGALGQGLASAHGYRHRRHRQAVARLEAWRTNPDAAAAGAKLACLEVCRHTAA